MPVYKVAKNIAIDLQKSDKKKNQLNRIKEKLISPLQIKIKNMKK